MDLQITKEKDMPLLKRKRVNALAAFTGSQTPSNMELRLALAKMLKVEPKSVIIRHIFQRYGSGSAKVIAHVYKDEKLMKVLEKESRVKMPEPKKEEPKAEAPKEESKAEEKKEEVKEEAKEDGKEESKK